MKKVYSDAAKPAQKCENITIFGREPWSSGNSRGRGFESQRRILDGCFPHNIVVKISLIEKDKNQMKKRQGIAHFKNYSYH